MVKIVCKNVHNVRNGSTPKPCHAFLAILTDAQIEVLKQGGESIFRCRVCPSEQRWIKIYYHDDKFVFETIDGIPEMEDIPRMEYQESKVITQVG